MEIEFSTTKDIINQAKHGLSLTEGVKIFEDKSHVILSSIRLIDGEGRFKAVGFHW